MIRIFIDADACPVRVEACRVADRHGLQVYVVSNGGIRPDPHPLVETVIVPEGADAADKWIADRIGPGDICVTGDVPLAARVIEAGGRAIRHSGEAFTQANIGHALAMRDLMADLRAANPLGAGGGARPFCKADRSRFLDAFDRLVRSAGRPG
ncbi:MAG: YaiI/YqxD family protein [Gemmatimonadetes bacterium]|nr:YaiI/YqxD family protein [Gemmatimonadota bacterium]